MRSLSRDKMCIMRIARHITLPDSPLPPSHVPRDPWREGGGGPGNISGAACSCWDRRRSRGPGGPSVASSTSFRPSSSNLSRYKLHHQVHGAPPPHPSSTSTGLPQGQLTQAPAALPTHRKSLKHAQCISTAATMSLARCPARSSSPARSHPTQSMLVFVRRQHC